MAGSADDPAFRRASDTRALPDVPSVVESAREKRSRWQSLASSAPAAPAGERIGPKTSYNTAACTRQVGSPAIGPLGPPLTRAQASQLVDNAFGDKNHKAILAPYKSTLVDYIVEFSADETELPPSKRRAFATLDRLSKHICGNEYLKNQLQTRIDETRGQSKDIVDLAVFGYLRGVARNLASGYDVTDQATFCFNDKGEVYGTVLPNRTPQCASYLDQQQEFKSFLSAQSDPFKGSQQGVGRRRNRSRTIKKKNKKSKKTLRRK